MNDDSLFFSFSHHSDDGNWNFDKNYPYGTPWSTVLTDFLSFLSGVYGYNVSERVEYVGNPYLSYVESKDE